MLAASSLYSVYFDTDGKPLSAGFLYFGQPNQNPEVNPVTVYWDAAGTQPAAQPIRTLNGWPARNGTPAVIYVSGDYSQTVRTRRGEMVFTFASAAAASNDLALQSQIDAYKDKADPAKGAGLIGWILNAAGAVGRWLSDKLSDSVSSKDFGAKGDFNLTSNTGTDDTAAIQAAWNWCAANGRRLKQVGVSKITAPLIFPATGQLEVVGAGAAKTFDSGYAYRGTGTMLTGTGVDRSLTFANFRNLVFDGPGIDGAADGTKYGTDFIWSRCMWGDFYQGGATGCIFRNWSRAVECFGSINTFRDNRWRANKEGLVVTNWPAGSSQANVPTTTFVSERNNFYANTGYGLKVDSSGTGGDNIVSSCSRDDVFEQNGVGLYLNKSFDFLIEGIHTELHTTWAIQSINSNPTIIKQYVGSGDGAKMSFTWPGATANMAGLASLDGVNGLITRGVRWRTQNGTVAMTANDAGGLDVSGAGIVGAWTPSIGASGGTSSGNTYSLREGFYLRFGNLVIATYRIVMTAKDAGMGGAIYITGLPFAADPARTNAYGNQVRYSGVTLNGGAFTELIADVNTLRAEPAKQGSGLNPSNLAPADVSGTATFSGTLIYYAAP